MGKINILPENICNQIAAGEVIERPAAVVKELIENSIDANSNKIFLSLLKGGRKEIRVVDDGIGMDQDDALLALERYATSKLKDSSDIQSIKTLGFRGEALPSIAAVSRFELTTKEPNAISGTYVRVEGGEIKEVKETGAPHGTMVIVRDLFYNLPGRRKFLRSTETEMAHITDRFLRLALAYPAIGFKLRHQERISYDLPRAKNIAERAIQIMGTKLAALLKPFHLEEYPISVEGLAAPPDIQRATAQSIFIYVNGRPVQDRLITRAIMDAYDTLLPKGRYPLVILFLKVPPGLIDVNVHPTKREIRFHKPSEVTAAVQLALKKTLKDLHHTTLKAHVYVQNLRSAPAEDNLRAPQQKIIIPPVTSSDPFYYRFEDLPVVGQLGDTYILLEAPDALIFIDQHAAHERILYNKLIQQTIPKISQKLARPVILELLPLEAEKLNRSLCSLREIGFEIEPFGTSSFIIHAVPSILDHISPEVLIKEAIANEGISSSKSTMLSCLAKIAACHGAIRAGQKLATEEIRKLLHDLDKVRTDPTCPHGRPLWWKLPLKEIDHHFKRV